MKKSGKFDFSTFLEAGHLYTEWDTSLSVSEMWQPDAGWLSETGELRVQAVVYFQSVCRAQKPADFTQQILGFKSWGFLQCF